MLPLERPDRIQIAFDDRVFRLLMRKTKRESWGI